MWSSSTIAYPHHSSLAPSDNHECKTLHRPKFVCVDCRRTFKAAVVEGNEYHIWSDSWHRGWWCSPSPSRIPEVWAGYKSICSVPARIAEKRRLMEIRGMALAGQEEGETFGDEEMNEYKKSDPELWWKPLDDLRCPGCGKAGTPVGGAFRAPPQKDDRGLARVAGLLAGGELFNYCLTQAEEAEVIKDAELENLRRQNAPVWAETKARRISELKNAPGRTEEEGRKLARMRSLRAMEDGWVLLDDSDARTVS